MIYRLFLGVALSLLAPLFVAVHGAESLKGGAPLKFVTGRLIFDANEIASLDAALSSVYEYGVSNDEASAQQLVSATSVLGFASQVDSLDVFRIALKKGDVIALTQAPASIDADLDLFAQSVDGRYMAVSASVGGMECIRVTRSGEYFLRVFAAVGMARYRIFKVPVTFSPKCGNETFVAEKTRGLVSHADTNSDVLPATSTRDSEFVAMPSRLTNNMDAFARMGFGTQGLSSTGDLSIRAQKNPIIAVIDGGFGPVHKEKLEVALQSFGVAGAKVAHAKKSAVANHGSDMIGVIQRVMSKAAGDAMATYMALQVYGAKGEADMSSVAQAVLFAARLPNQTGGLPPARADVINISMGAADRCRPEVQEAIELARAVGVVIVSAAGNDADNRAGQTLPIDSPASCHGVISVGSISSSGAPSRFSHSGPSLSLVAPGGDIDVDTTTGLRRCFDPGWIPPELAQTVPEEHCGSSISTAFVSAVIAAMKARAPGLTPDDIDVLIRASRLTHDVPKGGHDDLMGYGVVNIRAALDAVLVGRGLAASDPFAPKGVVLDEMRQQGWIRVRKAPGDRFVAARVESPGFSLNCKESGVDNDAWLCRVTFNPKGMRSGLHFAHADISTLSERYRVPIRAVVHQGNGVPLEHSGLARVWIVDVVTNTVVASADVQPSPQGYVWRMQDLPEGRFYVIAGVDVDGNGRLCEDLEPCGALLAANGSLKEIDTSKEIISPLSIRMQTDGLSGVRGYAGALHR